MKRHPILKAAAIVAATLFAFAPIFHAGWLGDWDDAVEILGNRDLRDWAGLGRIWAAPNAPDYFPLKTTVQWVQWHLWHANPAGYHLTNIGLHLLSAFLLWQLLRTLGVRLAWLGGLIFAIHPLTVESVAWISELKNVLSLPLLLLAMLAYLDWNEEVAQASPPAIDNGRRGRLRYYLASLFCFLAAMICKSSVVMFPVILLLYSWWKRGRIARSDLLASAPFFAVSLVLGLVTLWFQAHRAIGGEVILAGGLLPRVAAAGLAIAFYFRQSVFPTNLMPIYPRWAVTPPSLWQFWPWVVILGWGGVSLRRLFGSGGEKTWTTFPMRRLRDKPPYLLFGLGFFFINLIPVLGFVPMSFLRLSWVADHFVYLPLVGLVGLASAGIGAASDSFRLLRHGRSILWGIVAVAIAALALESRHYAEKFADVKTLWSYDVRLNPGAWAARNNLGNALLDEGRVPEAIDQYEQALRLKPDYAEVHNNLGNIFAESGRTDEAAQQYELALQAFPEYSEARNGLGNLLLQEGRVAEAIAQLELAIKDNPRNAAAYNNLGNALYSAGRYAEAKAALGNALRFRPHYAEAHNNLGNVFWRTHRMWDAADEYLEALRINPGFPEAHNNLGNALMSLGQTDEAIGQFEQALRLRPDYPAARYNLALAKLRDQR